MDDEANGAKTKLIRNETAKLSATFINGLAIGVLVVGGVAPSFTYLFASQQTRPPLIGIMLAVPVCLILSATLHFIAKRELRALEP